MFTVSAPPAGDPSLGLFSPSKTLGGVLQHLYLAVLFLRQQCSVQHFHSQLSVMKGKVVVC